MLKSLKEKTSMFNKKPSDVKKRSASGELKSGPEDLKTKLKNLLKKLDPKKHTALLKNKKFIACSAAVIILICAAVAACSIGSNDGSADSVGLFVRGAEVSCPAAVYTENGAAMVPARAAAEALGASCEWNGSSETLAVTIDPVTVYFTVGSDKMTKFGVPVQMDAVANYSENTLMVPARALAEAFGYPIEWNENNRSVNIGERIAPNKNPMDGVTVTDDFRHEDYLGSWNGVSVFSNGSENFGMELLSLGDDSGAYADAVAKIALSVPSADVYDILVPTAQEFYAPNSKRINQTAGISSVYNDLLSKQIPNLRPINVVSTLSEHAGEMIYFRTDHHWTQRGAYYAYAEYSRQNESIAELDPLQTYRTENNYGYLGSLCGFTAGTNGSALMSQNPDMLQFFYPKPEYEGAVYSDPFMSSNMQSVRAIYPWLQTYSSFLQGDFPLEVYKTNVNNGRKLCILKESYGDAFSVWALNNYEEIYIVDYRMWNGGTYGGYDSTGLAFKIKDFYDFVKFDDLIIISYPVSVSVEEQTNLLAAFAT